MRRIAALLAFAVTLAACGGADLEPPADLDVLLSDAAVAMGSIGSARFEMVRGGAPVEIAGLDFVSAEGQYSAPDRARAILDVKVNDISAEVGTIAIGPKVWLTNPLTGAWEAIPEGSGFNIAVIFDPATGWVPLLTDDLSGVSYAGTADAGDGPRYVVHGDIAAPRVEVLTAGLVSAQAVEADIWIHPDTGHITRVEFATVLGGAQSEWTITLSDFDEPVTIEAPSGA
ncbi:MAG: LppX_LprAFG lipoprotein [Actinobacteria bacterium]|nr:LppX_LprAFG lipoprotein [Actinomycetota bacterium]